MKKRFLIITNGKIQSPTALRSSFSKFANFDLDNKSFTIICADGGINNAAQLSLKADYLIGDFDSIDEKLLKEIKQDRSVLNPEIKDCERSQFLSDNMIAFCVCKRFSACLKIVDS